MDGGTRDAQVSPPVAAWGVLLLDALPDPAFVTAPDGTVAAANAAGRELLAHPDARDTGPGARPEGWPLARLLHALTDDPPALPPPGTSVTASLPGGPGQGAGRPLGPSRTLTLTTGSDGTVVAFVRRDAGPAPRPAVDSGPPHGAFAARLCHELRTPLNAVLGFAQLLELDPLPDGQRDTVERLIAAGRHMQTLLDDGVGPSAARAGRPMLDVRPVPVLRVAREVLDVLAPLADTRHIARSLTPALDVTALADRTRLWQVLLNLVGNAVRHGRDGGRVRVGVTTVERQVEVEVEDDGPGLPVATRERLSAATGPIPPDDGERMGLSLSRVLVEAMGGRLTACTEPGRGTTFRVWLPAAGQTTASSASAAV